MPMPHADYYPSFDIAGKEVRLLPPIPRPSNEKPSQPGNEIFLRLTNSTSYGSLTGDSLRDWEPHSLSLYKDEDEINRDLARISQSSTYSDLSPSFSTCFGRRDSLDMIAEHDDIGKVKSRPSLLPHPLEYRHAIEAVASVECRLSSSSTQVSHDEEAPLLTDTSPNPKRSTTRTLLEALSTDLETFARQARSSSSARPTTPVPSLAYTQSSPSSAELTPTTRRASSPTVPIMDPPNSPTPRSKKGVKRKPKAVITGVDIRNISPPMPSPAMPNSFDSTLSPVPTNGSSVDAYQPSRPAPIIPSPVNEVSRIDWDSDDGNDATPMLSRMKKSFADLKAASQIQKRAAFTDDPAHMSPPLPQVHLQIGAATYRTSPPISKYNASTDSYGIMRHGVGNFSIRSPGKLSKKPSVKGNRPRAETATSQPFGKTSAASATLLGAPSPALAQLKKNRFSIIAASSKSGRSRQVGIERFKRWARKLLRR